MQLQHIKMILGASWILTALVIGVTVGMNSVTAVALLLGFAFVPPALMMMLWNHPRQTMSESIQRARR